MAVKFLNKKTLIRTELLKDAFAGNFPSYTSFGKRVGVPAMGPWQPVLDVISDEETHNSYPDITFLLKNKTTGYPGQIGFVRAKKPTGAQAAIAHREVQQVIDTYCPGTKNPY